MNILITGANGFVGRSLIPRLVEEGHKITALVRSKENLELHPKVTWIEGDLLKKETLPELGAIHKAYYLVHGLKSSKEDFEYQESLAAVNFINWIRPSNPGIVYLGGLGPSTDSTSPHLRSRQLTGGILGASGMNTLEFRASIVLGEGSLSFEMIKALSERLPFRPEMSMLAQPCQPLALDDLLNYLLDAVATDVQGHEVVELGGPEVVSYGELLDLYAELSGLKRKKIRIPEVESKVIMKVLDYSIPEHSQMGKKLAETLEVPTVIEKETAKKRFPKIQPKPLRVAMDMARANSKTNYPPLWEKDFLKHLLSDKIMTQSGLLSPELLKNLEKVGKLKDILTRR